VCNKRFSDRSSLEIHHNVHTGERPYCCDVCKKHLSIEVALKDIIIYIQGCIHIAVMCAIKDSAIEVALRYIIMYILGSIYIAVMCAIKHLSVKVP